MENRKLNWRCPWLTILLNFAKIIGSTAYTAYFHLQVLDISLKK
jgi:hypothetical protein